ncbi:PREDICTED: cyclin-D5-1-like [Camelina sativa]|uniref:Cyclin-D5-1-like n=1 Tax=Camelina sativa TaxID=90675 RepID=A0ABM0URB7_CAMSA|nr:PREDICTED: cyclin-D5-1-like [Camelina sativa]
MAEPSDSIALSNLLLCHESESSLNLDEERIERSEQVPHFPTTIGDDEDYVAELVRKENRRFETEPTKTSSSSSSFDRLIAIDWILTTRTRFGFQHQTAYIAISYLDLFLHKRFIGVSSVFAPFHYLNYFLATISPDNNQSVSKDLVLLRSSDSLLALTKEVSFTEYRQFAVAAATTMLASSTSSDIIRLTREEMANKFGSISWWTSNENENVYLCYQRMLEIEDRKHMTPPPETSVPRDIQPPSSGSGAKRRLSFDDSDQTSSAKRMRML